MILAGAVFVLAGCTKEQEMEFFNVEVETYEVKSNNVPEDNIIVEDNQYVDKDLKIREMEEKVESLDDLKYETTGSLNTLYDINLREKPDYNSPVITVIERNTTLNHFEKFGDYYRVEFQDELGYIKSDLVEDNYSITIEQEPINNAYVINNTVVTTKDDIKDVSKNSFAKIYGENIDSYIVEIDGIVGYIPKGDIEILKDNYVVVDISDQELNLYHDNDVLLTAPVITGMANTRNATPTGKYNVGYKPVDYSRDRYLKNIDGSNSAWVDYMIRFNGGIGLHDAEYHTDYDEDGNVIRSHGWKNTEDFGGETYKTAGSHGCVNMRHDDVAFVYDNIKPGDVVLVKK